MKPKDGKKKKSFAKKIKRGLITALQFLGVLVVIYGWPFLMRPKQQPVIPGYKSVSFNILSAFDADEFKKRLKTAVNENRPIDLPQKVKALGGEKVSIMGYMIPLESEGRAVKTFALVRDQASCCFGGKPKLNEWVYVTMKPPNTAPYSGTNAIVVNGTLEVGATILNQGGWNLYRLSGESVQKV